MAQINLSNLSPHHNVWEKHRANADIISDFYRQGQGSFKRYAHRMRDCAKFLEFCLVPESTEDLLESKLSYARFCRVRHCPICQWRRSLMWKARAYKVIPQVVADYPKSRWLFITLTVQNCPLQELRTTLNWMNRGFKRLTELKAWPAKGWVKSVEVTKGKDGESAHPHFHVLAMVPPSYFSHGYIAKAKWGQLWQKCLRIDYTPVLHVSAIAKSDDPMVIIPEILKYQVKESDLVANREWFLELTRQLHQTRGVAVGGVLRQYMRQMELEHKQRISQEGDEVDDENVSFTWKRELGMYIAE
ncbi:MAG: protein rep [Coleofasciculus sp. C1-SOL-03]|uniref:protein rep n=1 Tax=Coleofasciculus sp. C1-SOL-03 TaxID=3069522 RepID=UPI0032F1EBD8